MNTALVVALVAAWILVGLLSGLWMARHGHDPLWTLIAVVLGPLFIPIAIERVQRHPGVATFGQKGSTPQRAVPGSGLRVLVGLDGSADAERGLATTLRLFGGHCALLVLAEVVHFEAAESETRTDVDADSPPACWAACQPTSSSTLRCRCWSPNRSTARNGPRQRISSGKADVTRSQRAASLVAIRTVAVARLSGVAGSEDMVQIFTKGATPQ